MKSNKMVPKMLLKYVKNDTRSITCANIRKLLILTKKRIILIVYLQKTLMILSMRKFSVKTFGELMS